MFLICIVKNVLHRREEGIIFWDVKGKIRRKTGREYPEGE